VIRRFSGKEKRKLIGNKIFSQDIALQLSSSSESLLFCAHDDPNKEVGVKDMSRAFRFAARKLEKSGALTFEIREGKPSELRLYNLRKFFRKYANQMGFEHVNYLMGHTVRGSDANYKPQDPEFYRDLYAEKAMPFLRLEEPTPTETGALIKTLKKQHETEMETLKKQLQKRDEQIQALNERFNKYEPYLKLMENNFKPNPSEQEIQVAQKLLPDVENFVFANPNKIAELFTNNPSFLDYLCSRIPSEEMAKAEKLAKEQNTTKDAIIKKKFIEILNEILKEDNSKKQTGC
jgi:hypothetical protein